ncbi:MAG: transposase [Nitrososphaerota archaeon]|nr:transposase [Nitrososphaerota archaeon]MDG6953001.1 transposase [Nitrososphaerota archaeon]MDG6956920.1 transposase [Nitrososphaerota archaeon]MDG6957259.1 transposase [Nitrososphaerota archaeon]MDG6959896.1 transposase [Nitrososphaerota archaeon]
MPKANESLKGLGAKYGGTLRKRYARVWRTLKQARECPSCASMKLARSSSGIWKCKSCGYTVAGGAYELAQAKSR